LASWIACCPAPTTDAFTCAEATGTVQDIPAASSVENNNDFFFIDSSFAGVQVPALQIRHASRHEGPLPM
jgi:hypothetical protein